MDTQIVQNDSGQIEFDQLLADQAKLINRWRAHYGMDVTDSLSIADLTVFSKLITDMVLCTEIGSIEEIHESLTWTYNATLEILNDSARDQASGDSVLDKLPIILEKPVKDLSSETLLNVNLDYYMAVHERRDEIIEAAIALYRERFPDDKHQPIREHSYIDGGESIVLCDAEDQIGEYYIDINRSGMAAGQVTFEFVSSHHEEDQETTSESATNGNSKN